MKNQRTNNTVAEREYVGAFQSAWLGSDKSKHSLVASHREGGDLCLTIYHKTASGEQGLQSIMLTNEQKKNLAEFLTSYEPELWRDLPGEVMSSEKRGHHDHD